MKKMLFIGSEAGGHAIQIGIQAGLVQGAYQACSGVQCVAYPQTLWRNSRCGWRRDGRICCT